MILQVKVKVKIDTLKEFGEKLLSNKLDRSAIISETYCEKDEPSIGISNSQVNNFKRWQNEKKYL